jgi:hypothetical protein
VDTATRRKRFTVKYQRIKEAWILLHVGNASQLSFSALTKPEYATQRRRFAVKYQRINAHNANDHLPFVPGWDVMLPSLHATCSVERILYILQRPENTPAWAWRDCSKSKKKERKRPPSQKVCVSVPRVRNAGDTALTHRLY